MKTPLNHNVIEGDAYPEGGEWVSLNVHWWDSCVLFGRTEGPSSPGGSIDVWARGGDFAEAVANAIRYVEGKGHHVDIIAVNI